MNRLLLSACAAASLLAFTVSTGFCQDEEQNQNQNQNEPSGAAIGDGANALGGYGSGVGKKDKDPAGSAPTASGDGGGSHITPAPPPDPACTPEPVSDSGGYPRVLDVHVGHESFESRGIVLSGDYLYVSGHPLDKATTPGLETIDVSDPGHIRVTSIFHGTDLEVNGGAVTGKTLYIAGWNPNSGLFVFDLTAPSTPKLVQTIVTPNYSWGATVTGNLLDVGLANETNSGVVTYDISNPQSPKQIWTLQGGQRGAMGTPARIDQYMYLPNLDALWIYDASDPANPKKLGEYDCGQTCGSVVAHDGYLYMAMGAGVHVLDVSDPEKPKEVGLGPVDCLGGMNFSGDRMYMPASGCGVYIFDVSNPVSPHVISNVFPEWPGAGQGGYPIAAAGSGPYLFVGSTNSAGVHPAGSNKWIGYGFDSPCFGERVYSVALEAPPGSN